MRLDDLLHKNRDHLRQFALPIFFLQRHALELALKPSIKAVDFSLLNYG